mmetsp:Transcript_27254/g.40361  ORF Transcript_27254/g.40361 Transcript_27254/m.40361 type:complete len:98 (-) Transcript_27254:255-548(-)
MPPQSISLYDAALITVVPRTKDLRKKTTVKVVKKKDERGGVIDFGFVRDKNGSTSFQAEKMRKDIAFIKKEVIWEMFIKQLLGGGKKRKSKTKTRPR